MKISIETLKTLIMYHIRAENEVQDPWHLMKLSEYVSKRVFHQLEVQKLNELLTELNEVHGYDK